MKAFFIKVANFFRIIISTICKLLCRKEANNIINIDLDNDGQSDIIINVSAKQDKEDINNE